LTTEHLIFVLGLLYDLERQLHGQHLVKNAVVKSLKGHFNNKHPDKALVLSFHGWTGSGKNFVSRIIADNIFESGMKSSFVHLFIATHHFPHADKTEDYKVINMNISLLLYIQPFF